MANLEILYLGIFLTIFGLLYSYRPIRIWILKMENRARASKMDASKKTIKFSSLAAYISIILGVILIILSFYYPK